MVCIMNVIYTYSVTKDLHDNIVRLHIIANSDSDLDQSIKYHVRNELIKNSSELKNQSFNTDTMKCIAERAVLESGADYAVTCSFGDFYFPVKRYENIILPSGTYRGVKIILGNGEGRNWWCVLSPPLCFTENALGLADTDTLNERLNADTIEVISDKNGVNYKFKIVELISELKNKLSN